MPVPGAATVIARPAPRVSGARRRGAHTASRLTNGSQPFLDRVDQRSVPARRMLDLRAQFLASALRPYNVGQKGLPAIASPPLSLGDLTVTAQAMLKNLVTLVVQSEIFEAKTARGEEVDNDQLVRTANLTLRVLDMWGSATAGMDFLVPEVADALRARRAELIAAKKQAEAEQAAQLLAAVGPKGVHKIANLVKREQRLARAKKAPPVVVPVGTATEPPINADEIERLALERAGLPLPDYLRRSPDGES